MQIRAFLFAFITWTGACLAEPALPAKLSPGAAFDYAPLAFDPAAWKRHSIPSQMISWEGKAVVFLTTPGEYDGALMGAWVAALDAGWQTYASLTGRKPSLFKQLHGKPTIAAVPDGRLTCGAGCGYVGATGIELAMFYDHNLPALKENSKSIPHYVFYEMGRNFYTFGDRHSCFITGFAVFMRYVCMDALQANDNEADLRKLIEDAEKSIAASGMPFVQTFTNLGGLNEKAPRLKRPNGKWLHPSDQPVIYASAMLRLRRECGGDAWLKRFFAELVSCPKVKPVTAEDGLAQSWHWLAAASAAAKRDLSPVFADEWRLPLTPATRKPLQQIQWDAPDLSAAKIISAIKPEWAK